MGYAYDLILESIPNHITSETKVTTSSADKVALKALILILQIH